jgi:hypothetical protein
LPPSNNNFFNRSSAWFWFRVWLHQTTENPHFNRAEYERLQLGVSLTDVEAIANYGACQIEDGQNAYPTTNVFLLICFRLN